MKYFKLILLVIILISIALGAGFVTYLCFSSISEQREAYENLVLVLGGVTVPVLTLILTIDFKTSKPKS